MPYGQVFSCGKPCISENRITNRRLPDAGIFIAQTKIQRSITENHKLANPDFYLAAAKCKP